MIELALELLVAYLLGSVSGSLLLGRLIGADPRGSGSGNAGATNALRTHGVLFALGVALIDIGKGVLAVVWVPALDLPTGGLAYWSAPACGLAAVAGHVWPVFFGFRGGKGAATAAGVVAVLAPLAGAMVLAVWLLCLLVSGYVGLSSVLAAAALPLALLWTTGGTVATPLLVCMSLLALLVIAVHHGNLRRLAAGTENRFERIRIRNWFR